MSHSDRKASEMDALQVQQQAVVVEITLQKVGVELLSQHGVDDW